MTNGEVFEHGGVPDLRPFFPVRKARTLHTANLESITFDVTDSSVLDPAGVGRLAQKEDTIQEFRKKKFNSTTSSTPIFPTVHSEGKGEKESYVSLGDQSDDESNIVSYLISVDQGNNKTTKQDKLVNNENEEAGKKRSRNFTTISVKTTKCLLGKVCGDGLYSDEETLNSQTDENNFVKHGNAGTTKNDTTKSQESDVAGKSVPMTVTYAAHNDKEEESESDSEVEKKQKEKAKTIEASKTVKEVEKVEKANNSTGQLNKIEEHKKPEESKIMEKSNRIEEVKHIEKAKENRMTQKVDEPQTYEDNKKSVDNQKAKEAKETGEVKKVVETKKKEESEDKLQEAQQGKEGKKKEEAKKIKDDQKVKEGINDEESTTSEIAQKLNEGKNIDASLKEANLLKDLSQSQKNNTTLKEAYSLIGYLTEHINSLEHMKNEQEKEQQRFTSVHKAIEAVEQSKAKKHEPKPFTIVELKSSNTNLLSTINASKASIPPPKPSNLIPITLTKTYQDNDINLEFKTNGHVVGASRQNVGSTMQNSNNDTNQNSTGKTLGKVGGNKLEQQTAAHVLNNPAPENNDDDDDDNLDNKVTGKNSSDNSQKLSPSSSSVAAPSSETLSSPARATTAVVEPSPSPSPPASAAVAPPVTAPSALAAELRNPAAVKPTTGDAVPHILETLPTSESAESVVSSVPGSSTSNQTSTKTATIEPAVPVPVISAIELQNPAAVKPTTGGASTHISETLPASASAESMVSSVSGSSTFNETSTKTETMESSVTSPSTSAEGLQNPAAVKPTTGGALSHILETLPASESAESVVSSVSGSSTSRETSTKTTTIEPAVAAPSTSAAELQNPAAVKPTIGDASSHISETLPALALAESVMSSVSGSSTSNETSTKTATSEPAAAPIKVKSSAAPVSQKSERKNPSAKSSKEQAVAPNPGESSPNSHAGETTSKPKSRPGKMVVKYLRVAQLDKNHVDLPKNTTTTSHNASISATENFIHEQNNNHIILNNRYGEATGGQPDASTSIEHDFEFHDKSYTTSNASNDDNDALKQNPELRKNETNQFSSNNEAMSNETSNEATITKPTTQSGSNSSPKSKKGIENVYEIQNVSKPDEGGGGHTNATASPIASSTAVTCVGLQGASKRSFNGGMITATIRTAIGEIILPCPEQAESLSNQSDEQNMNSGDPKHVDEKSGNIKHLKAHHFIGEELEKESLSLDVDQIHRTNISTRHQRPQTTFNCKKQTKKGKSFFLCQNFDKIADGKSMKRNLSASGGRDFEVINNIHSLHRIKLPLDKKTATTDFFKFTVPISYDSLIKYIVPISEEGEELASDIASGISVEPKMREEAQNLGLVNPFTYPRKSKEDKHLTKQLRHPKSPRVIHTHPKVRKTPLIVTNKVPRVSQKLPRVSRKYSLGTLHTSLDIPHDSRLTLKPALAHRKTTRHNVNITQFSDDGDDVIDVVKTSNKITSRPLNQASPPAGESAKKEKNTPYTIELFAKEFRNEISSALDNATRLLSSVTASNSSKHVLRGQLNQLQGLLQIVEEKRANHADGDVKLNVNHTSNDEISTELANNQPNQSVSPKNLNTTHVDLHNVLKENGKLGRNDEIPNKNKTVSRNVGNNNGSIEHTDRNVGKTNQNVEQPVVIDDNFKESSATSKLKGEKPKSNGTTSNNTDSQHERPQLQNTTNISAKSNEVKMNTTEKNNTNTYDNSNKAIAEPKGNKTTPSIANNEIKTNVELSKNTVGTAQSNIRFLESLPHELISLTNNGQGKYLNLTKLKEFLPEGYELIQRFDEGAKEPVPQMEKVPPKKMRHTPKILTLHHRLDREKEVAVASNESEISNHFVTNDPVSSDEDCDDSEFNTELKSNIGKDKESIATIHAMQWEIYSLLDGSKEKQKAKKKCAISRSRKIKAREKKLHKTKSSKDKPNSINNLSKGKKSGSKGSNSHSSSMYADNSFNRYRHYPFNHGYYSSDKNKKGETDLSEELRKTYGDSDHAEEQQTKSANDDNKFKSNQYGHKTKFNYLKPPITMVSPITYGSDLAGNDEAATQHAEAAERTDEAENAVEEDIMKGYQGDNDNNNNDNRLETTNDHYETPSQMSSKYIPPEDFCDNGDCKGRSPSPSLETHKGRHHRNSGVSNNIMNYWGNLNAQYNESGDLQEHMTNEPIASHSHHSDYTSSDGFPVSYSFHQKVGISPSTSKGIANTSMGNFMDETLVSTNSEAQLTGETLAGITNMKTDPSYLVKRPSLMSQSNLLHSTNGKGVSLHKVNAFSTAFDDQGDPSSVESMFPQHTAIEHQTPEEMSNTGANLNFQTVSHNVAENEPLMSEHLANEATLFSTSDHTLPTSSTSRTNLLDATSHDASVIHHFRNDSSSSNMLPPSVSMVQDEVVFNGGDTPTNSFAGAKHYTMKGSAQQIYDNTEDDTFLHQAIKLVKDHDSHTEQYAAPSFNEPITGNTKNDGKSTKISDLESHDKALNRHVPDYEETISEPLLSTSTTDKLEPAIEEIPSGTSDVKVFNPLPSSTATNLQEHVIKDNQNVYTQHSDEDATLAVDNQRTMTDANLLETPSNAETQHVYSTKPHVSRKPSPVHVTMNGQYQNKDATSHVTYLSHHRPHVTSASTTAVQHIQRTHLVNPKTHHRRVHSSHHIETGPQTTYFFDDHLAPQIVNKMQDVVQNIRTDQNILPSHRHSLKKTVATTSRAVEDVAPKAVHTQGTKNHKDVFEAVGSPDFISSELEEQSAGISNIQGTNSGPMIPVQDVSSSVVQLQ